MTMNPCPGCGRSTPAEAVACATCGQVLANRTAPQAQTPAGTPIPPAEVSSWVIDKTPPEMIEAALGAFNEEEFLAEVREIEQTGGVKFEDFIGDIEEIVKRRD
jgi:hypothetical protein